MMEATDEKRNPIVCAPWVLAVDSALRQLVPAAIFHKTKL